MVATRKAQRWVILILGLALAACATQPPVPAPPQPKTVLCSSLAPVRLTLPEIRALSEYSKDQIILINRVLERECGYKVSVGPSASPVAERSDATNGEAPGVLLNVELTQTVIVNGVPIAKSKASSDSRPTGPPGLPISTHSRPVGGF